MVEIAAASGLLTASSVMIVGLSFIFDRIDVPRENRAKGMLFSIMTIGYLSALGCLYIVALPASLLSGLTSAKILFDISTVSMVAFLFMMAIALFPDEAVAILE